MPSVGFLSPPAYMLGMLCPPWRLMATALSNLGELLCSAIRIASPLMVDGRARNAFPFKAVLMLSNVCLQVSLPKTRSQICDIFVSYGLMKLTSLETSFYRCKLAEVFIRG